MNDNQKIEDILAPLSDPTTISQLGKRLTELRINKGITQADITTHTGLTQARIIDIEQGKTNYTIESFISYLKAIECEFTDLSTVLISSKPVLFDFSDQTDSSPYIKSVGKDKSIFDSIKMSGGPGSGKSFTGKSKKKS